MYTYTIILYGIILIADELVATKIIRRTIKGNDGGAGGGMRIRRKLQHDSSNSNNNEAPHMMGKAAFDFPVLSRIPNTKFNCKTFDNGYYADVDTSCQVFHICDNGRKTSFLCPNGTIFRQSHLTCDWWFRVDCPNSNRYYNQAISNIPKEFNSETALPQYNNENININNNNNENENISSNNNENEYGDNENQILAESASFARSNDYLNQIQSSSQSSIFKNKENKKTQTTSSKNSISETFLENSSNGPVIYYPYETQTTLPHHLLTGMTKEAYDSLFGEKDKVKQNIDTNNNNNNNNNEQVSSNDIDYTTNSIIDYTTTTELNNVDELSFKSSSNLRELAQIFSRALSSYLENPEEFRKVLSEVRPTEPAALNFSSISEEKEILNFSENTKPDTMSKPQVFAEEINGFMSKEQLDWASTEEKEGNSIIRRTTRNPIKIDNEDVDDGLITSDTQSFWSRDNHRIQDIKVKTTTTTEKIINETKNDLVLLLVNKKSIRNDGKKELLNALIKKGEGGVKEEELPKDKSRPSRKTEENTKNQLKHSDNKNDLKQSDNRAIHLLSSLYSLVNSK